ncbi:MAG: aldo/keto reductase [Planctomycetes bacterium]|nr:aldo/keto reductase [Planctomycetota bacterium]
MERRRLGRTGPWVSPIAIGGNVFGHFCGESETRQILDAAEDLGINLVDTADVYSEGRSEELLGAALEGRRDRWTIASKVGVRSHELPLGKGRRDHIIGSVEGSLRRLRTDRIDLCQMHHFDPATPIEETLAALDQLVRQGKVRYPGVSNYSGTQLAAACDVCRSMDLAPLVSIQTHYNLLKREAESGVFPVSQENGVGVAVYGALGRGVLSGKYRSGAEPPADSRAATSRRVRADLTGPVLETAVALDAFARTRGRPLAQLAIAWVLLRDEVGTVIVGFRDAGQLRDLAPAGAWRPSDAELKEIDRIIGDRRRFETLSLGAYSRD